MKKIFSHYAFLVPFMLLSYVFVAYSSWVAFGSHGWLGSHLQEVGWVWFLIAYFLLAHVTISAMSLSFHRFHTHKGVIIHPALDFVLQSILWLVTGMNKLDWVSIHRYHHQHSDQPKDPHSPVQKGVWHVFLWGVADYVKAKELPEVVRLRQKIPVNHWERFFSEHALLGPALLTGLWLTMLGPAGGTLASVLAFSISPLFAVGGVNALAHHVGYRNHHTRDNSRNLGFLFPLNWIICGELDHNNHHKEQHSCSFRHKWYEFDIGYVYIRLAKWMGLMQVRHLYNTTAMKAEFLKQVEEILKSDSRIKKRCEILAKELNTSYQELQKLITAKLHGKKIHLPRPVRELVEEVKRTTRANYRLSLVY